MNQQVIIYAIKRTETGDCYIGSTVSLNLRWVRHRSLLKHDRHHCRHLQNAWNKYGDVAFEFVAIDNLTCNTRHERYVAETAWISELGHYNTNVASDRSGVFTVSDEAKDAARERALAKAAADPAYRAFLEERGRAIAAYMQTEAGRAGMSELTKRRWADPELRKSLAQGLINRWADPNARDHMSKVTGERMRSGDNAAKHSEKLKAAWADPVKGARLKARLESRWKDPDAKARQAENMRRIWAERRAAKAS